MLHNLCLKTKKRDCSPIHYSASATPIPKPDKDNTRKESYRPMSLMHAEAEILRKILVNEIQQCVKGILHHEQVEFILEITRLFDIQVS